MEDLSKLFEEAGITAEEFKKHFLDPVYPDKNPVIIEGVVYIQESDGKGGTTNVAQGTVKEILEANPELLEAFMRNYGLDEEQEVFIEWLAHHLTSTFDEKGQKKEDKIQKPKIKPEQQVIETEAAETQVEEGTSLLGSIVGSLKSAINVTTTSLASVLNLRKKYDPSEMSEVRDLAAEQNNEIDEGREDSHIKEAAAREQARIEKETADLSGEINIIDAVYDKLGILTRMKKEADMIAKEHRASAEEIKAAQQLSDALKDPSKVSTVGVNKNNEIVVNFNNPGAQDIQKRASIIRAIGRMSMIRTQLINAIKEARTEAMENALKDAGSVSLGKGGADVSEITAQGDKRSNIEMDKSKEAQKSK